MADMKKIVECIMNEAREEAKGIVDAAYEEACIIKAEAQKEAERIARQEQSLIDNKIAETIRVSQSAREAQKREELLGAKQGLIEEALQKLYSRIKSMPKAEYYDIMLRLLKEKMRSGKCVIYLAKGDKLADKIKHLVTEKKCEYTVSYEREDVSDGFVMVSGGIEENCTLDSLFEEKYTELCTIAAKRLFETEGAI